MFKTSISHQNASFFYFKHQVVFFFEEFSPHTSIPNAMVKCEKNLRPAVGRLYYQASLMVTVVVPSFILVFLFGDPQWVEEIVEWNSGPMVERGRAALLTNFFRPEKKNEVPMNFQWRNHHFMVNNLVVEGICWGFGWWQHPNIFWCSPRKLGKMNPFWRTCFSDGLVQPPTSYGKIWC